MKTIMLFEDRPEIRIPLFEALERRKYKVLSCATVNEATQTWKENCHTINVIILDVMMSSIGMGEKAAITEHGHYTGWIWLWNYLKGGIISAMPNESVNIILYSAYLNELGKFIAQRKSDEEMMFFYTVRHLSKEKCGIREILFAIEGKD